jgi:hypothetical protein
MYEGRSNETHVQFIRGKITNCMYEGRSNETHVHVKHDVKATVIHEAAQAVLCRGDPLTGSSKGSQPQRSC